MEEEIIKYKEDMFISEIIDEVLETDTYYANDGIKQKVMDFKDKEILASVEKEMGSKIKIISVNEITKNNALTI